MNKDFHYYATFLAARTAGYDDEQAFLIANSAQFVDEYTIETAAGFSELVKDVKTQPTFENLISIFTIKTTTMKNWRWIEKNIYKSMRLWCSFHFLPGNLELKEPYGGADSSETHGVYPDLWTYSINGSKQQEDYFKCLCLNNSTVLKKMMDNLLVETNLSESPFEDKILIQTGIMMHVLADTWAHNYFSGIPTWFINDATCDLAKHFVAPGFNSYFYLGHCQLQHIPDRPYQEFTFSPQWKSTNVEKTITKDNRVEFLSAFKQMAYALRCQFTKKEFMLNTYVMEGQDNFNGCLVANSTIVSEILSTIPPAGKEDNEEFFCKIWEDKFNGQNFKDESGAIINPPGEYTAGKWYVNFKSTSDKKMSKLYMFNNCAVKHSQSVMDILYSAGIYVDCEDNLRKIIIRLKSCSKKKYIGKNSFGVTSSDCPCLHSSDYIYLHAICDRRKTALFSGDLIHLKTLEHDEMYITKDESSNLRYFALENPKKMDNKKYMTADKAMTIDLPGDFIFYQHKDYGAGIQCWEINKFKEDLSIKDEIVSGDKVYFRSAAYPNTEGNRRYLSPKDSISYLTTRLAANINEEVLWEIEIFDTPRN